MNTGSLHPTPLPAGWYRDPDPFQAERRGLFARGWMPLAPVAVLAGASAYVCTNLAGWPLFAWRDAAGELRAFHNVCRHQKMPMLQAGGGALMELRCPFHGWTYRQDGSLRHAPPPETPDVADLSSIRLDPLTIVPWQGLLFVTLADATLPPPARAFAGFGGSMPDLSDGYDLAGSDSVDLLCNWKTYLDFAAALDTPAGGPMGAVSAAETDSNIAVVTGIGGGTWLWAWPTLGVHVTESVVAVSLLVARTMIRSRLERHVFVRAGGDGAAALAAWKTVGLRQKQLAEAAHKALATAPQADASMAAPTPSPAACGLHDKVRAILAPDG